MPLPLVHELEFPPSVEDALCALADKANVILFDSALTRSPLGRYSFLAADPFQLVEIPSAQFSDDPFVEARSVLQEFPVSTVDGLPPFQGGAAGIASYELGRCWERLPVATIDEFQLPALTIGIYDWVLAWDHQQYRCWLISHGFPEKNEPAREDRARNRLDEVLFTLRSELHREVKTPVSLRADIESEAHSLDELPGLISNFTRDGYLATVERVIEYIRAGDIYQANLSQRLLFPTDDDPLSTYLRLRNCNPAPFAGYFVHDDWVVLSASPERFLSVSGKTVETRPIKGTRQRRAASEVDLFTSDELQESEKDVAENVMIVDLLRNDLSRVCRPGSVRVPKLCSLESYETVHHLVSEIQGELCEGKDAWDLLTATFPGGSITGCPKVRAMEIITELEQVARGPYCGSLFYVGFDGTMDSNILIRTMTQRHGWLQMPVGGGVTAQSNPEAEYAETLHKAAGMIRALKR